jgi:hypothetical protein
MTSATASPTLSSVTVGYQPRVRILDLDALPRPAAGAWDIGAAQILT